MVAVTDPTIVPLSYGERDRESPPLTMRDMPEGERPLERLRQYGAGHLSNAELIAILFRTGLEGENVVAMAMRVLTRSGGLSGMSRATYDSLCEQRGVSDAKACQLLAALELGRRVAALAPDDRQAAGTPADIARLFMGEMAPMDREQVKVVLLDVKNRVIAVEDLYTGNVSSVAVRPAEVFSAALKRNCPSIAMVHNHPSGDPTPGAEDVVLTERLVKSGRLLDIELIDHVVIAQGRYVSMREKLLGFDR